jgi:hypothetical protein
LGQSAGSPGKTRRFRFLKNTCKAINKVVAVNVILENLPAFNAATDDVVAGSGRIYSVFSQHNSSLITGGPKQKAKLYDRP